MKKLINDTENYILDICTKFNFKIIIKYIYNIKYNNLKNNDIILLFNIFYNDYNYEYCLKILDNNLVINIKLKNNTLQTITVNDKCDFKKLLKIMISDK